MGIKKLCGYFVLLILLFTSSTFQLNAQCSPDVTPPVAVCHNISAFLDVTGNISITPAMVNNGSTDNCSIASMAFGVTDQTDFDCSDIGSPVTVTLTVMDGAGLSSSCMATITAVDNLAPSVICQNININLDASGNASITETAVHSSSSDNCGVASFDTDITNFNCTDVGTNPVTLSVTDIHGNVGTCIAIVTVNDNISPVPSVASLPADSGVCTITVTPPTATDNCSPSINATTSDPLTYNVVGSYTINWTYTDIGGNIATQTQTIVVTPCIGGIGENVNEIEVNIYPNPGNGIFTTSVEIDDKPIEMRLVSSLGQVVYNGKISNSNQQFDFSYLTPGIYHLSLVSEKGTATKQIVIKK